MENTSGYKISANELRIGNWVIGEYGKPEKIISMYPSYAEYIFNIESQTEGMHEYESSVIYGTELSKIKPIPLTPEILEKAGFKKKDVDWHIGQNPITHDWLFWVTWLDGYDHPFYRNGYHKIKYVHQLQNLYYCLTGGELNIEL